MAEDRDAGQQIRSGRVLEYPHLHILVSEGGLHESSSLWVRRLGYCKHKSELMRAWRFAAITYLAEALKGQVLTSEFSAKALRLLLETQYERPWHIDIGRRMSKTHFLRYVGRYIRRPHVAQHRLTRVTDDEVEYLAKDTRNNNRLVTVRYSNQEFVFILKQQVQDRGRHAMRYFGLLAPRSKAHTWSALFLLLKQKQRVHPRRLSWRWLRQNTFGADPLSDSSGQTMHWVGRLNAAT